MSKKARKYVWLAAGVIFVLGSLFILRLYLLNEIRTRLEEQLQALRDSGYIVSYDSISINTRKNLVAIYQLSVTRDLDSALCGSSNFFSARYIEANGLRIMPLLLKRRLSFQSIELDSPKFTLYKSFFKKREKNKKKAKEFSITIEDIKLPHMSFNYYDSIGCDPHTVYTSNANVEGFVLSFYEDQDPYYNVKSVTTDSVNIKLYTEMYSLSVQQATLNLEMGTFDLDTLKIIPHHSKIAFGREKGKEVDRIEGTVPYINLYGLQWHRGDSSTFEVNKMTMQAFLKVFRDKRLPFKNKLKPLPMAVFKILPVGIKIDSLIMNKSFVQYEEFAEEADSSGMVFFDDLYASAYNVNNAKHPDNHGFQLVAEASLMGQGKVKLRATCPFIASEKYTVKGSLRDMDFSRLNEMLEPQLKLRLESGRLNELLFDFNYDDDTSNGRLELDYRDLKLVTFRSDEQVTKKMKRKKGKNKSEEELQKAPLKTLVVNAFIKKNMDDSMPEEKTSGTIHFERDKRRSIFNYWAKSLFSGLKSAYKIDKLEDSKLKKLFDKKEH